MVLPSYTEALIESLEHMGEAVTGWLSANCCTHAMAFTASSELPWTGWARPGDTEHSRAHPLETLVPGCWAVHSFHRWYAHVYLAV